MNKLRNIVLLFLLIAISLSKNAFAQQDPQYSQYMFNQMVLNPAYAGSKDAINAAVSS